MSEPVSDFAETIVFGGQFPKGDPAALRRLATAWREFAAACGNLQGLVGEGVQGLRGALDAGSHVGRGVIESGAQLRAHTAQLAEFGVAVANWLDDVANDVELALAEMSLLLIAVLCAGTSVAAAAQARARFLVLLEGLVSRIGLESAAVALARAGLFAVEGAVFGAAQAGVNTAIQLAQPTRHGLDWEMVGTAGLAGAGSALGGRLGAGMVARFADDGLGAGWGRAVVAAGAGVFGVLGAAVATGRDDLTLPQLVSGAAMGFAAHAVSAARQGTVILGTSTSGEGLRPVVVDSTRLSGLVRDGTDVARLARLSEHVALEQLLALSTRPGSSVELVGPAGPGQISGGDGGSLPGPKAIGGEAGSPGGGTRVRPPGDVSWSGPNDSRSSGSGFSIGAGGSSMADRAGPLRMGSFGSTARGGDGAGGAATGTGTGLPSMWRDIGGGALPDGSVGKPVAHAGRVGVLEPDPLRESIIRPDRVVEIAEPDSVSEKTAVPGRAESPGAPTNTGTRAFDGPPGGDAGVSSEAVGGRSGPSAHRSTTADLPTGPIQVPSIPPSALPEDDPTRVDGPDPVVPEPILLPGQPSLDVETGTSAQPGPAGPGGGETDRPAWSPAVQPWEPVAPDLTRPGAPDDTTLRPPVLDRPNPHPHVIESPGVVADPAEPGHSLPPLPPVSDVPASMPDPTGPVRFRAGDDFPESPAGDRTADPVADGQGGSTEAAPDHTDVPAAAVPEESSTVSGPRVVVVGRPYFYCTIETNGFPALGESRLADSLRLTPGGEALNYARALARNGADVSLIGAIGDDRLGESIREMLEREGIGADGIRVVPRTPNPISICFIADSGATSFVRNTARALELERRDIERHAARLRNADVVLIGAELPDEVAAAIDAVVAGSGVVVARSPAAGGGLAQITVPGRRELEGALPLTLPQSAGPAGRIADPQSQPTETVEPPPHHPPVGLSAIEALASAAGSRAELLAELAGRKRVLAFGGAVGDLVINVDGFPDPGKSRDVSGVRPGPVDSVIPGGKTLNVAVAAARLGAVVDMVSAIGRDIPGDAIAELFRREGIGTRGIRIEPEVPTPICACFVDDDGEASFLWRIPRELELTEDDVESLSWAIQESEGVGGKVDIFIVTYEVPEPALAKIVAIARENDIKVVLQPAPVRSKFSLDTVRMVDLLVLNKIEAQVLLSAAIADVMDLPADRLAEYLYELLGVSTIAVTLGAEGCVVHHLGHTEVFPAHGVEAVVDTTGASDAFTAAFALGVFAELPIAVATQRALAAAAHTITRPGGHESMPYPHQLELMFARHAEQVGAERLDPRDVVVAAEHSARQFGLLARQSFTAATDPEAVGPTATQVREQSAREITQQRLALIEVVGDATGPDRAAARQQLASIDSLASARLRTALALAAAVGAAEQDWAHALDILDRELVAQLRAHGVGDTGVSDPDTGNCAVSALLALRDLYPDSDIRLLDSAREPAGVHLGEIVAAAGGALEDLGRAELRDRLLDSDDSAVAALVLTQWKFPDDKGSQGHVELVTNYRASRLPDENGVVLSVDESCVREFSTGAPGEVFQHLAILFDGKGKPLRPLGTREREQYRSQLLVPFGRTPDRDPAETLAALRTQVRRSVAVGHAAELGAHEHQIDVLEQALRGATVLRDHLAKRLITRAGVAPVPGLWHNELDLGELERRERNGRARLAELLPPGPVAEHLQALPHDQQRYSPEVNELYRYYLSVDSTLSLAEAYLECRNRLADSERAVNELATAADDLQRQADLIARMDRELAQRTSESRGLAQVVDQRDRLLAKHRRAFEHLLTSLRTRVGVVVDRAPLTVAVADLRAAAQDEFRSLCIDLEGILAEGNYGMHVDEALSAESGVRRELVRERELARSRLITELVRAGRTDFLPDDLADTEQMAHIAEIVDQLTADGYNSMLLVTLAVLENALHKIQVVERAERARSLIDTIDELERALTGARLAFMGALGTPRVLLDDLADTYLRMVGLVCRLDRRTVAAREAAEQQAATGLDPAWIERVSAKYLLPHQESPLDRHAERRMLDKLLRTGAWLIAIIGKNPADLTDEQIRLAQLLREPLGSVPHPAIRPDVLESPTGLEWSGLADNDADWRQFKAALVHEYIELRQYVAWRRAVHRRRFGLAELDMVLHDTVADVARELDGVRRTPTIDTEYQAREGRLGPPLLALREQIASMAADAAKTFSSFGTRTGVESITQLWPGSAALREVEKRHAEVRAEIADQMLVDEDQVTLAWAGDQLADMMLHEQRTLIRQLETFRDLAAMLVFAADFHRAEIWIRAIDAVDTGLVQARLWQEHGARHGVLGGWGYRLAGLTDLVRNLNELAQRREALADPPRTPTERRLLAETAAVYGVTLHALIDDPLHHREPMRRWRAVKSRQFIGQLVGLEPEYRVGDDGEWTESRVRAEVGRLDRLAQQQPSPAIESALRHGHEILAIDDLLAFVAQRSAQLTEMDELDRTLDTLFEKAAGWGVAVQRVYAVLNPPLTCLLTMFEVAARGNGLRPRFRVPEKELGAVSLHGVDGADAARWAGANWRRFRDVAAAFEWVRASAGSPRTVVLAVDYQPLDHAVGANALVIKIDDSGSVVAAETEQQLNDDGNMAIGVRYIEGEAAVRVWATMMSTDAGAAAVHALAFQGDTPVDPLIGSEPDNVRNRQIPHGSIHGPPSRPDSPPAADVPAVRVVRFRGLKNLTGVDLGIAVAVRTDEQQPSGAHNVADGPRGKPETAGPPDPALAVVLAQRPQPAAIVLSGSFATIAERARAIRAYVDDRGVPRERLVLVAVPEDALEPQILRMLSDDIDDVVLVPERWIADGVVQLSAVIDGQVTADDAAGVMAVLQFGGLLPGVSGETHDLRGQRVAALGTGRTRAVDSAPAEGLVATPSPATKVIVTPWSTRTLSMTDTQEISRRDPDGVLEVGGVRVEFPPELSAEDDPTPPTVIIAGAVVQQLNSAAIKLLVRLLAEPGVIVPWNVLQRELLGDVNAANYHSLHSALHDLRKSVGGRSIITVPGFGPRFDGVTDRIAVERDALVAGSIRLERPGRRIFVGDELVELGRLEFDLLEFALRNQKRVLSWATIRRELWPEPNPTGRMLEETYSAVRGAFVQLRRKISVLPRVLVVREMGCRFGGVPGGVVVEFGKPGETRIIVDGVPVRPDTRHRPSHDLPAYALLACLVARAGRIVPLSTIVAEVYGGQAPKSTVDSIVASARRRLGSTLSIVEVPGFGWRFDGVGERIVIDDGAIEVGGVRLEPPGRRVFVHDNQIEFSRLTFDLLELLMKNAGRIVGRAEIRAVWDSEVVSDAALTSALKKLRGLLGDSSSIALVPGFGWRFDGVGAPILDVAGAVVVDEFWLEPSGRRFFCAGVPIRLSRLAFDVLEVLMANAGAVVPMSTFDGGEWRGNRLTRNSVVNAVGELRRKLGDLGPRARRIKSIGGVGFRFEVGSDGRREPVPPRYDQNPLGFHRGGIRVETAPPAVFVGGIKVVLGSKQYGVLRNLIGRSGVVSYQELAAAVWGDAETPVNTMQSLVDSLRARIGDTDRTKPRIELVRGVGYRFNDDPPREAPGPPDL